MIKAERIAIGSIVVGCLVLALKTVAWWVTGSVALYSDALESIVNVAASVIALVAIRVAAMPSGAASINPPTDSRTMRIPDHSTCTAVAAASSGSRMR